jgi:hypothetical protein
LVAHGERRKTMLFMTVSSWSADKRDEIIKRRLEKGAMTPKGVKVLGEWTVLGKSLNFQVAETDDPKLLAEGAIAWNDILDMETYVVLDTDKDLLGLLK